MDSMSTSDPHVMTDEEIDARMAEEAKRINEESEKAWQEEQERRKAEKAESDRLTRNYLAKIRILEAQELSADWFARQMAKRIAGKPKVKITNNIDKVGPFLVQAYGMRVGNDNRQCVFDEPTCEIINIVARWMTSSATPPGLMLRGAPGVGKSTMMLAITDVFAIMEGKATVEVTAMDIARAGTDQVRMKELADVPMLAIDDLGTEPTMVKSFGNEISPMVELLTERHRRLRFTIITTNLVEIPGKNGGLTDQINERYGDRVADRLKQLCGFVKYPGELKSYR